MVWQGVDDCVDADALSQFNVVEVLDLGNHLLDTHTFGEHRISRR